MKLLTNAQIKKLKDSTARACSMIHSEWGCYRTVTHCEDCEQLIAARILNMEEPPKAHHGW